MEVERITFDSLRVNSNDRNTLIISKNKLKLPDNFHQLVVEQENLYYSTKDFNDLQILVNLYMTGVEYYTDHSDVKCEFYNEKIKELFLEAEQLRVLKKENDRKRVSFDQVNRLSLESNRIRDSTTYDDSIRLITDCSIFSSHKGKHSRSKSAFLKTKPLDTIDYCIKKDYISCSKKVKLINPIEFIAKFDNKINKLKRLIEFEQNSNQKIFKKKAFEKKVNGALRSVKKSFTKKEDKDARRLSSLNAFQLFRSEKNYQTITDIPAKPLNDILANSPKKQLKKKPKINEKIPIIKSSRLITPHNIKELISQTIDNLNKFFVDEYYNNVFQAIVSNMQIVLEKKVQVYQNSQSEIDNLYNNIDDYKGGELSGRNKMVELLEESILISREDDLDALNNALNTDILKMLKMNFVKDITKITQVKILITEFMNFLNNIQI